MQWLIAFHVIAMIAWFAGLFYLPRLFVYHTTAHDVIGRERFKVMEHKLYYYIMTPAALATTILGGILFSYRWEWYFTQSWMITKILLVLLLWIYHLYCGHLVTIFKFDANKKTERFYRFFNEIPTALLIAIILLVFVHG